MDAIRKFVRNTDIDVLAGLLKSSHRVGNERFRLSWCCDKESPIIWFLSRNPELSPMWTAIINDNVQGIDGQLNMNEVCLIMFVIRIYSLKLTCLLLVRGCKIDHDVQSVCYNGCRVNMCCNGIEAYEHILVKFNNLSDASDQFLFACCTEQYRLVDEMLSNGLDINVRIFNDQSVLHTLVLDDYAEMIHHLYTHGINIDSQTCVSF
jgi:hypothetical protein